MILFTLAMELANLHVIRKDDLQRLIKKLIPAFSVGEAGSRMIHVNINAFR